jgi:hypothetical protein
MDRTFGIELETVGISDDKMARALRVVGLPVVLRGYTHQTMNEWKIVPDGSVRGNDGSQGWEAVSPILRDEAGMTEAATAIDALKAIGCHTNKTTGLHCHLGVADLNVHELKTILRRYAAFEREIDAFMPPSRREDNNRFCKSIRSFVESRAFRNANTIEQLVDAQPDRYYKVNLHSWRRYKTIEFRQHNGIVDADRALYWIRFLDAFVAESVRIARNPAMATAADSMTLPAAPAVRSVRRLTPSQQNLLDLMRQPGGATASALASRGNIQSHSARAVVTRIRQAGYTVRVRYRNNVIHYEIAGAATPAAPAQAPAAPVPAPAAADSLYAGVETAIAAFYRNRAAVLALA